MTDDVYQTNRQISNIHHNIASSYLKSGSKNDCALAFKYFKYSADLGNIASINKLAFMYQNGIGVQSSILLAEKHYSNAIKLGSNMARFNLALIYLTHHSTAYSKKAAIKHLNIASSNSLSLATTYLATLYQYGYSGVERNISTAISLFNKAAKVGSPLANNSLGVIYSTDANVLDYSKALKYFSQGTLLSSAEAQYNLGTMYQNGEGVEQDYSRAAALYLDSATSGYVDAMFNIAMMFQAGIGVDENLDSCIHWLQKASTAGDSESPFALAMIYTNLDGVVNKSLIQHYYKMAANAGHIKAINHLKLSHDSSANLIFLDF